MSQLDKFPMPKVKASTSPQTPEEAMSWEPEPVTQESPEVCAKKIEELEALFTNFESKYDLESLRSITRFMTKEERRSSPRAEALIDIAPVVRLVNFLKGQRAFEEAHKHFQRRYRVLTNSVIGVLQDSPDGIGEIVVRRRVEEDGTVEE